MGTPTNFKPIAPVTLLRKGIVAAQFPSAADAVSVVLRGDTILFAEGDHEVTSNLAKNLGAQISACVRASGTVTVTTSSDHGFAAGDLVSLLNTASATISFDGVFRVVSAPTSTTFTVRQITAAAVNESIGSGGWALGCINYEFAEHARLHTSTNIPFNLDAQKGGVNAWVNVQGGSIFCDGTFLLAVDNPAARFVARGFRHWKNDGSDKSCVFAGHGHVELDGNTVESVGYDAIWCQPFNSVVAKSRFYCRAHRLISHSQQAIEVSFGAGHTVENQWYFDVDECLSLDAFGGANNSCVGIGPGGETGGRLWLYARLIKGGLGLHIDTIGSAPGDSHVDIFGAHVIGTRLQAATIGGGHYTTFHNCRFESQSASHPAIVIRESQNDPPNDPRPVFENCEINSHASATYSMAADSGYGFVVQPIELRGTTTANKAINASHVSFTGSGLFRDNSGFVATDKLTAAGIALLDDADAAAQRTTLGVAIGSDVQAFDADLSAVAGLSTSGFIARTGAGTAASRTIAGTTHRIDVANGDGVSGNPTLTIPEVQISRRLAFQDNRFYLGVPNYLGANSTQAFSTGTLWAVPFLNNQSWVPTRISGQVTAVTPTVNFRMGVYSAHATTLLPETLLGQVEIAADGNGIKEGVLSGVTITGPCWLALTVAGSITFATAPEWGGHNVFNLGMASGTTAFSVLTVTASMAHVYGSLPSTFTPTVGVGLSHNPLIALRKV